jgi:hypothetical protein
MILDLISSITIFCGRIKKMIFYRCLIHFPRLPTYYFLFLIILIGISCGKESTFVADGSGKSHLDCKTCHMDIWNEWHTSPHARAWNSDVIQAAFHNFGFSRKCQSCHAPEPILFTGLKQPPILRKTSLDSGVNCLSCHEMNQGMGVAAVRNDPRAFCNPIIFPAISQSEFCGVCHVPIFNDWSGSRYAKEGKTCIDCHMRNPVDGKINHQCTDLLTLRSYQESIQMNCFFEQEQVIVEVTNYGVGHNFPGERHNRTLSLNVIQFDDNAEIQSTQKDLIKGITPFRGESTQDKIKIDQTVRFHFPVIISQGVVKISLLLKQFPWLADNEATVVKRIEITLK